MATAHAREKRILFQSCHVIIFKMSIFQQKITRHAKKQKSIAHMQGEKKKKLIETVPEEAHALHLLDKDLKSTVIYSQRYKGTTDKKIKGSQHGVSPNRISIK